MLFFSLEKFGLPCDLPPKREACLKCKFHLSLHEWANVRTYVSTDGRTITSQPKFLGCINNQIFLPYIGVRVLRGQHYIPGKRWPKQRILVKTRIAERRFLTGLPRGYFFWGEGAAIHTQATIKSCRRPLRETKSHVRLKHKLIQNIVPFWKTFVTKKKEYHF